MASTSRPWPERFGRIAGPLPEAGVVPASDRLPFQTVQPVQERIVERDGVKLHAAQWGSSGPWIAFAQPFQIVHSQWLKGVVPYLSQHFRVLTMDGRGNGRSDRPQGQQHYSLDHFHDDFVAVLDAFEIDRVALVGLSAAAMIVLRLAAEQPHRVTHVITTGGFAESLVQTEAMAKRMNMELDQVTVLPERTLPFASLRVAVAWAVLPSAIDVALNDTATDATEAVEGADADVATSFHF